MRHHGPPAAALLALSAIALVALAEPQPLRLRYRPGQTFRFRVASTTVQSLERGDRTVGSTIRLTQEIVRQVEEVDGEGVARLASTYGMIACVIDAGPQHMEYDSRKPEDAPKASDPVFARHAGLVGRTVRLRIAPSGRVVEVRGFDEIGREISDRLDPANPSTPQARAGLADHFTDAATLRSLAATSEVFPAGPVEPGQSWNRTAGLPVPAVNEVTLAFTYTWQGNESVDGIECAHVVGEAKVTLPAEPLAGGKARLDEGVYRHDVWLDLAGGFVRRAHEVRKLRIAGETAEGAAQTESVQQETELSYLDER